MSFQQGLSGLNASSKNLEVIGNNIANANTFGAKASRAEFVDLYANALSGTGVSAIGIGVNLSTVAQQFTQGNVTTTENPLDLAINGKGFFQLAQPSGVIVYGRNGQFKVDRDGFIVSNLGLKLQGYQADSAGVILPGQPTGLQMPVSGLVPSATTQMQLEFNLDARLAVPAAAAAPNINTSDPATYNSATTMTVYDAKGQDVALTYYFQKTATDNWNVYVTANGTPLVDDGTGNPTVTTTITFPTNGSAPTIPVGPVLLDIPASTNLAGAATEPITGVALDLSGATQFGSSFSVAGAQPGRLCRRATRGRARRRQRHRHGRIFERTVQAGGPSRTGDLPQPARPAAQRRHHLVAHLFLGRPGRRRSGQRHAGRAASRRAGGVQRRPDCRTGEHDHGAAHLPGERADDQDAGPDSADARQLAVNAGWRPLAQAASAGVTSPG